MAGSPVRELITQIRFVVDRRSVAAAKNAIKNMKQRLANIQNPTLRFSIDRASVTAASNTIRSLRAQVSGLQTQLNSLRATVRTPQSGAAGRGVAGTVGRGRGAAAGGSDRYGRAAAIWAATAETGYAGAELARGAAGYGNTVMQFDNMIRTLYPDEREREQVEDRLYKLAKESRSDLGTTGLLYSRIVRSSRAQGIDPEDAWMVTEALAKSLQLSGASAAEARGAMIQFTQGYGSGALGGDELHSLRENAPILTDAIAKYMGLSGADELVEAGRKRQITPEVITEAIRMVAPGINRQFAMMKPTIDNALQYMDSVFQRFFLGLEKDSGVFSGIAKDIIAFTDKLEPFLNSIREFTKENPGLIKGIAEFGAALAGIAAAAAVLAPIVFGISEVIGAIGAAGGIAALASAAWPLVAVFLAVAAAIDGVRNNWDLFSTVISPALPMLKSGIQDMKDAWAAIIPVVKSLWRLIGYLLTPVVGILIDVAVAGFRVWAASIEIVTGLIRSLYNIIMSCVNAVQAFLGLQSQVRTDASFWTPKLGRQLESGGTQNNSYTFHVNSAKDANYIAAQTPGFKAWKGAF